MFNGATASMSISLESFDEENDFRTLDDKKKEKEKQKKKAQNTMMMSIGPAKGRNEEFKELMINV